MSRVVAALVAGVFAFLSADFALAEEKRVALIVGNSKYRTSPILKNPVKDAADMQVALQRLGFKMYVGQDLNLAEFQRAVRDFTAATQDADIALFFYAGHGIQYKDENYLLPTDIELKAEKDIVEKSVPLNKILEDVGRTAKASIVLLDACRDAPAFRTASRGPSTGGGGWKEYLAGLARIPYIPGDRFVGYAAAPGKTASDGTGKNSPFTTALLRYMGAEDVEINQMFAAVRKQVVTATRGEQHPEALTALREPLYLKRSGKTPGPVALDPIPYSGDESAKLEMLLEGQQWLEIRDTKEVQNFEDYLRRYPTGRYALLAKRKIDELKQGPTRPTPPEDGEYVVAAGVGRISKDHPKEEAQRSAQAVARARAVAAKEGSAASGLPSSIGSSAEAADMLNYMGRGVTYEEAWTFHWPTAREVKAQLKTKVRLFGGDFERRLTGQIVPREVVAGRPYRIKVDAKKDATIGVFAWQANGTVVRLYPESTSKQVLIKGGTSVAFPRTEDSYPAIASANMPGEQRNHEALVVVTGATRLKFDLLVPDTITRNVQHSAMDGLEFLNKLASIQDPELEVLVLPYEIRAE